MVSFCKIKSGKYEKRMQNRQKIKFIGCLYKSTRVDEQFQPYFETCLKTLRESKEHYPNSTFELHTDETLNENEISLLAEFADKVVVHHYPTLQKEYDFAMNSSATMRRKNCEQLTKCMRLARLFDEETFAGQDACVVINIHDNLATTAKLLNEYLSNMCDDLHYYLTTWKSSEPSCVYDSNITKSAHRHFDAGLVLAKKPLPSRDDIPFTDFCQARIMRSPGRLIKGVEEMLIDQYLKSQDFYRDYAKEIKSITHACKVDDLYYKTKASEDSPKPTTCKPTNIITVQHKPHSKALNALLSARGTTADIYMCTEAPRKVNKKTQTQKMSSASATNVSGTKRPRTNNQSLTEHQPPSQQRMKLR